MSLVDTCMWDYLDGLTAVEIKILIVRNFEDRWKIV